MRVLILVIFTLSLTACSSWLKRRECNKTNWFTHGEKVAMSGKRLDEDDFISQCRKVEADISDAKLDRGFKKGMRNYCQPETAYETGRKGKKLSRDLCDGAGWRKLVTQHQRGVREYCSPSNGISAGASGEKYNFICPKNMERSFLVEFKKGRKKYLTSEIEMRREAISNLDQQIRETNRSRRELQRQLSSLERGGTMSIRSGYRTIRITDRTSPEERKAARDDLQNEIRNEGFSIRNKERERDEKLKEIGDLKREIVKL